MTLRTAILAAAATLSFALAPLARAETPREDFSADYIKDVVGELGATNVTESEVDGRKILKFELNGLPFVALLDLCTEGKDCKGLVLMVAFKRGDQTITLAMVNDFNGKNPFVSVSLHEPDVVAIMHALFAAGGMPRENLKANITEFWGGATKFVATARSQLVAGAPASGVMRPVVYGAGALRPIVLTPVQIRALRPQWTRAR